MPLDAATLGAIFAGAGGIIGGVLGNRAQNSSIDRAIGAQTLGTQQGEQALTNMFAQARSDLSPYRTAGENSLKQLQALTYGTNYKPAPGRPDLPSTNALAGFGGGSQINGIPNVQPGSGGGAAQFGTTPTYQPGAADAFKPLLGAAGAGLAAGGAAFAGGALGSSTLAGIGLTALSGPFMPILLGLGAAASAIFGRHNDDKVKATATTNGLSKLVWGDNLDGKGGLSGALAAGAVSPDQANQIFSEWWSQYPSRMQAAGVDSTTVNRSLQSQQQYFSAFGNLVNAYKQGKIKPGAGNPFLGATPAQGYSQGGYVDMARGGDGAYHAPWREDDMALGFAMGGRVNPLQMMRRPGPTDTVPAALTPGEYVMPRPMVQMMGGPMALDQIRRNALARRPMGFQTGGRVPITQNPDYELKNGYYIRKGAEAQGVTPELLSGQRAEYNANYAQTGTGNDPYTLARYNYEQQRNPIGMFKDLHSPEAQSYIGDTNKGIGLIGAHQAVPQNLLPAGGFKPMVTPPKPITATGGPSNARTMNAQGQIFNPNGSIWNSAPGQNSLSIAPQSDWNQKLTLNAPAGGGAAAPEQWMGGSGFDVAQGSTDPNINHQVYGTDYFPGATPGQGFGYFSLNNGWPQGTPMPLNTAQFNAMTPQMQGLYRTILAKWHSAGGYSPNAGDIARYNPGAGGGNPLGPGQTPGPGGTSTKYGNYPEGYIPTVTTGPDGADFTLSPLYQLQLREGEKNLNRYLLSRGRSNSTYGTNAMRALSENLLANEAEKNYQRVQFLTSLGLGAAGQSAGASMNLGQLLASLYGGNALNLGSLLLGQGANNANLGAGIAGSGLSLAQLLLLLSQNRQNPLSGTQSYNPLYGPSPNLSGDIDISSLLAALGRA